MRVLYLFKLASESEEIIEEIEEEMDEEEFEQ